MPKVEWLLVGALSPVNDKDCIRAQETFIERYVVERTNEAQIRPKEQSKKAERCRENLWNEIQLKGP